MAEKKAERCKKRKRWPTVLLAVVAVTLFTSPVAFADGISINATTDATGSMGAIQLLFLFAAITLAPILLIMMTSFTRIIIVLSFLRNALGLQQTPPNQVLIGLSLFLTMFIMQPVLTEINTQGLQPYLNGEITQEQALENMEGPIKSFMLPQTKKDELNMFVSLAQENDPDRYAQVDDPSQLGLEVIVPAFLTSELKRAFTMGFLLYLPFLVIDMIVSSTLMSMGMVMLPPSMISLPFKLMLFVLVDGWSLLMQTLVASFR